jgi:multimeric flavodoxin WrbA
VLLVTGSSRNDGTCTKELSESWRLAGLAQGEQQAAGIHTDLLALSMLTSEYGQRIFPYKGCVSTAMPLCHWPCSCYPNHSLDQVGDVMNVIYPRWIAADGIILITPVY